MHPDKRTITLQIPVGVVFQLLFVWAGFHLSPPAAVGPQLGDRLAYAAQWYVLPVLLLIVMYFVVSAKRFNSDLGRDGSARDQGVNIHSRIMQNTHEQTTIFVLLNLALSTVLPAESLKLVPVLVVLFIVARIIYWAGYVRNPMYRTFGMIGTMYPNLVVLPYVIYRLLSS